MEAIIVDTPYKVAGGGAWRLECFFLELESTTQSWWGFGLVRGSVVPPSLEDQELSKVQLGKG